MGCRRSSDLFMQQRCQPWQFMKISGTWGGMQGGDGIPLQTTCFWPRSICWEPPPWLRPRMSRETPDTVQKPRMEVAIAKRGTRRGGCRSERASKRGGRSNAPTRFVAGAGGGRRWIRQEIKKRNGAGLSRPKEERRQSWCVGTDAESGKFDVSRGCSKCSEMQRDAAAGFSEMHRDAQTGRAMRVWAAAVMAARE